MNTNPLIMAVDAHECLVDMEGDMMYEIAGEKVFEPFDEELHVAVVDLVCRTAGSMERLSERARSARQNLIWKDFKAEWQRKIAART